MLPEWRVVFSRLTLSESRASGNAVKSGELDAGAEVRVQPGERVLHDKQLGSPGLFEVPYDGEPVAITLLLSPERAVSA